jgi:hypothetical protein
VVKDPYQAGLVKVHKWEKVDITGEMLLILDTEIDERGLNLMAPRTRALRRYEIHELLLTDEEEASPGRVVNRVAGIGFAEIKQGGVVVVGDRVLIENTSIGEVAGFDETHMPNHLNIVIKAQKRVNGLKLGLRPRNKVLITGQKG